MRALILHNIRSAENVGSMFRTADALGVDQIIISGYTPAPVDRFGRATSRLVKTALGAEKSVSWVRTKDVHRALDDLKHENKGLKIIALEQDKKSVVLSKFKPPASWALIVGNEVEGVERGLLDLSDTIVEIPMRGAKESLNVAVATGVALYHLG